MKSLQLLTSTLIGKEEQKKLMQLVQALLDNQDTREFREPVDWKSMGLLDYPSIIQKPIDLGTIKAKLTGNCYSTVEDCLNDIQLIWDNCKLYNGKDTWIHKLADKLEKIFRKMIKNYLPFILGPKKQKVEKKEKPIIKQPEPTKVVYVPPPEPQALPVETEEQRLVYKPRRNFLKRAMTCTSDQIGIIFLLIHRNKPSAIQIENGRVRVQMEQVGDELLNRLDTQLDMWGVGLELPTKKK